MLLVSTRVENNSMKQLSFLEALERPTVEGLIKPDQLFESQDWRFVAAQPENTIFDRKSSRIAPVDLATCLSAFGNGPAVEGGIVAIGIEKNGTITGCKSLFDDHLEIESPGGFMPSVSPDNFFHKPRNPFLMFVLREYGEVRCINEGTKRIRRELLEAHLPATDYQYNSERVKATLFNDIANRTNSLDSEAYKILGEAISFSLNPDERKLVNYAIENERINVSDALRILTTTDWHTAKAKLQRLVSRGIFDFITTKTRDPNAHYVIHRK